MLTIGCHLSASDGFLAMGRTALDIGANTFQFFTRNPRGSKAKAIDPDDAAALMALLAENGFGPLVAHAPYTINPCSKTERTREFARMTLADDLKRMEYLPGNYYNFHPGSHLQKISPERSLDLIAESINIALDKTRGVTAVIENTAGQGSNLGFAFEHLAYLIERVEDKSRVGVCIDTCHAFAAGYDLRTAEACDKTFAELERVVGFGYLKGMHLNDARDDRHGVFPLHHAGRAFRRHPADPRNPRRAALAGGDRPAQVIGRRIGGRCLGRLRQPGQARRCGKLQPACVAVGK